MAWDHPYKSLGELVFDLVEKRQTHTSEWMNLIRWFGLPKLDSLYEQEKLKRSQATVSNPPNFQESAEKLEW